MSKKKNLTIKETFALAVQNHQKNNLRVAENLYRNFTNLSSKLFLSIVILSAQIPILQLTLHEIWCKIYVRYNDL